ncbi:MAG: cbb3-type cytochrome c oxidase subunit I [Deltaproteobacteria bacterium]|nr:cbb3-type cytochrome c oxidase subunit I [Deltaproteobacteria bacterium]
MKKVTLGWMAIVLVLFPILLLLGIFMRAVQANGLANAEEWFYPFMTLHGVGMVGVWYVGAMACAERVIARYTGSNDGLSYVAMGGTVAGVVLLLVCVLGGKFASGWYFLYPLPFKGTWPIWSATTFLLAMTVMGAAWLVWSLGLLVGIARKYSLSHALGWHYIGGATEPDVPPAVIITTVSLLAAVASLLAGVVVLVFFFVELLFGIRSDALLMKNLTFFFGHVLVNLSLYLGVAVIYDVLPEYAGRPWKANKIVAISWNSVLAIVLMAYAHHLYMDFVQPTSLQYLGQIASYASSLPPAVVTIFGALTLVFHAKMRWTLASGMFFLALMGWAIGGVGAVIDSTIAVNAKFHNTLWVPAHFHTYMLEGLVLMVLGYFYHYVQEHTRIPESGLVRILTLGLFVIGGYGFLATFYLSGANSVPRRFATYPAEVAHGATDSAVGVMFAALFLLGLVVFTASALRRWFRASSDG